MMTEEQAKKIGIRACMDKLGYDFCMKYKDNAVSAYGKTEDGKMECFVGASDEPYVEPETPCLTSHYRWPYAVRCFVDLHTGAVEFVEEVRKSVMTTEDVPEVGIINPFVNTQFYWTDDMISFLNKYLLIYRDYPDSKIIEEFSSAFNISLQYAAGIERNYVVVNRNRIYERISKYEEIGKSQEEAAELISVDFGLDLENARKYVFRRYADGLDRFGVLVGNPELVDAEIYEPHPSIDINIPAYSRYIKEHGLTPDEITPEIMEHFEMGKSESSEKS